jgi:hypothetical protein
MSSSTNPDMSLTTMITSEGLSQSLRIVSFTGSSDQALQGLTMRQNEWTLQSRQQVRKRRFRVPRQRRAVKEI